MAALYYAAPLDWLFAIPFILMVWYALDREVVRYYRLKARRQEIAMRRDADEDLDFFVWPKAQ